MMVCTYKVIHVNHVIQTRFLMVINVLVRQNFIKLITFAHNATLMQIIMDLIVFATLDFIINEIYAINVIILAQNVTDQTKISAYLAQTSHQL
jgi:hypothetical protein